MSGVPVRCVIDTNVAVTANGENDAAGPKCVVASARALQAVIASGHLFIDHSGLILLEYRKYLRARGEPGPGDVFLKWLLTHEWGETRVTRVVITPKRENAAEFAELPTPSDGTVYDSSDLKFLAVAAAHPEHPPILQALDSKWWGWRKALSDASVTIYFLCEDEIAKIYETKMGS